MSLDSSDLGGDAFGRWAHPEAPSCPTKLAATDLGGDAFGRWAQRALGVGRRQRARLILAVMPSGVGHSPCVGPPACPCPTDLGGDAFGRWAQEGGHAKDAVGLLILAVMPSGVGHGAMSATQWGFCRLILAVMPSGVGHCGRKQLQARWEGPDLGGDAFGRWARANSAVVWEVIGSDLGGDAFGRWAPSSITSILDQRSPDLGGDAFGRWAHVAGLVDHPEVPLILAVDGSGNSGPLPSGNSGRSKGKERGR